MGYLEPEVLHDVKVWPPSPEDLLSDPVAGTKIAAKFSTAKYHLRESLLQSYGDTKSAVLPPGYPRHVKSAFPWGPDLDVLRLTHNLSRAEVEEVLAAVRTFNSSERSLNDLSPETFPLPTLGSRLRSLSRELHEESGAVILKGINPDKQSLRDNIVAFAGVSSYIGDQRGSQSSENDVLTHLYPDMSKDIEDPRPGLSHHGLPFHTDHCDVLALYVMQTALEGGETFWASIPRIYNDIMETKPHLVAILAQENWPHETAIQTVKYLPLLFIDDKGVPFLNYTRFALTGLPTYPRSAHILDLSMEQQDALDTVEFLARKHALRVTHHKGDMLFLNNRAALHARGKILDRGPTTTTTTGGHGDDGGRHLIRLCLRDSEFGRSIPSALRNRWGDVFDAGQRETGKWTLEKKHDRNFVSNSKFDSLYNDETGTSSHN